jgi:uncharacterized protein YjiS (DUF1127 family)
VCASRKRQERYTANIFRKNHEVLKTVLKLVERSGATDLGNELLSRRDHTMSTMQAGAQGALYPITARLNKATLQGLRPRAAWIGRGTQMVLNIVMRAIVASKTRKALVELQRLDDRMLRDIGLSRCELESAIRSNGKIEKLSFAAGWGLWGSGNRSLGSHD